MDRILINLIEIQGIKLPRVINYDEEEANVTKKQEVDDLYVKVKELLDGLNFGTITIVVQDGKVIQLEKSEKVRLK